MNKAGGGGGGGDVLWFYDFEIDVVLEHILLIFWWQL